MKRAQERRYILFSAAALFVVLSLALLRTRPIFDQCLTEGVIGRGRPHRFDHYDRSDHCQRRLFDNDTGLLVAGLDNCALASTRVGARPSVRPGEIHASASRHGAGGPA
jgi:hypothetical protein